MTSTSDNKCRSSDIDQKKIDDGGDDVMVMMKLIMVLVTTMMDSGNFLFLESSQMESVSLITRSASQTASQSIDHFRRILENRNFFKKKTFLKKMQLFTAKNNVFDQKYRFSLEKTIFFTKNLNLSSK